MFAALLSWVQCRNTELKKDPTVETSSVSALVASPNYADDPAWNKHTQIHWNTEPKACNYTILRFSSQKHTRHFHEFVMRKFRNGHPPTTSYANLSSLGHRCFPESPSFLQHVSQAASIRQQCDQLKVLRLRRCLWCGLRRAGMIHKGVFSMWAMVGKWLEYHNESSKIVNLLVITRDCWCSCFRTRTLYEFFPVICPWFCSWKNSCTKELLAWPALDKSGLVTI